MFTSLESGKDESEMQNGGLSLKRNPMVVSIIDGCETLKALAVKNRISSEMISSANGLILMRTDKVRQALQAPRAAEVPCQRCADHGLLCCCRLALASQSPRAMVWWLNGNQKHNLAGKQRSCDAVCSFLLQQMLAHHALLLQHTCSAHTPYMQRAQVRF